ncbi:hypothetical protein [Limimaricola sp.]|uniref:hypothetical protein n=1 Tax=Limimaricola sp. TaxID=2211665 RepID=UPI004059BBDD
MKTIQHLLVLADAYKIAAQVEQDSTVSHRVFGDTKKLAALREGADITTRRFNAAFQWFSENWPEGAERPEVLPSPELPKRPAC